jgi:hypothetical protein
MERFVNAFNPGATAGAMCRYTISVGWDGTLYHWDFNQMLDLPVGYSGPSHIRDFDLSRFLEPPHCALQPLLWAGSSCSASITAD